MSKPLKPTIRILFGDAISIGPGKISLLHAIEHTGSISAAAREMGMSYRRAWLLVDAMNHCFKEPLVDAATGGKKGGGAKVTELGKRIIRSYLEMEAKATKCVAKELSELSLLMTEQIPDAGSGN